MPSVDVRRPAKELTDRMLSPTQRIKCAPVENFSPLTIVAPRGVPLIRVSVSTGSFL
jgi:hypothetical protein